MMRILYSLLVLYISYITIVRSFPDRSRWSFNIENYECRYFSAHSALYSNSTISLKIGCTSTEKNATIDVGLVVRASPCSEEYTGFEVSLPDLLQWYYHCPKTMHSDYRYTKVTFLKTQQLKLACDQTISLNEFDSKFQTSPISEDCKPDNDPVCYSSSGDLNPFYKVHNILPKRDVKNGHVITVPSDNIYLFVLKVKSQDNVKMSVDVSFKSPNGFYLSAIDHPLLAFYAFMSVLYLGYAVLWLVISIMQYKELLRIQFCIAVVILLGMLEKAIFLGVYESLNQNGYPNYSAFYIAELFSCLKRTFARVLVIIVSCGYEIVKPHLGTTLNKIIAIGVLYFILGALEATMRIYKPKSDPTNQTLFASIPLALLETSICWWIFTNLMNTIKILRIRRNIVKLRLFNKFTNVLVFSFLASVIFMIWQISTHKFSACINDWSNLWMDDAFWHVLFSIILLVIMILWRPTKNNQRYAFTPLLDVSDDEDNEVLYDDSYRRLETGDVKNRAVHSNSVDDEAFSKETVDNLKWIEENISSSLIGSKQYDNDSDDEDLLHTKFEINKMQ